MDDPAEPYGYETTGRNTRQLRMRPAPEYDDAVKKFIATVGNALLVAQHPFLGRMGTEQVDAIAEQPASPATSQGASTGDFGAESTMILRNVDLLELNEAALAVQLWEMADQIGNAVKERFYAFLTKTCQEAGTSFGSKGRPLTHDSFMDVLEKIPFEVDEFGNPKGLELHCSPADAQMLLALPPMNEQQRSRFARLLKDKAEAQRAGTRTRRLAR